MSKITYDDKVALNVNSNIADINKVNASDMNEIKTVVNNNDDILNNLQTYSTNEIVIGKWIDNKPIYRKVVVDKLGTTNNSWKDIQVFSANYIDTVVNFFGYFTYGNANKTVVSIPYTRITDGSFSNKEYVLATMNTVPGLIGVIGYHPNDYNSLMSGQKVQFIIEYTKTTD